MRKISEVSRIAGVSRRALQYYDDEGVLVVERSEYNHRLYNDDSMDKIWQILLYKEMGFELEKIKQLLSVPAAEREQYFDLRMREIGNEMEDFEAWDDSEMNPAETAYYIEVQNRINQKLLEVSE